jgi:hypothetical protein
MRNARTFRGLGVAHLNTTTSPFPVTPAFPVTSACHFAGAALGAAVAVAVASAVEVEVGSLAGLSLPQAITVSAPTNASAQRTTKDFMGFSKVKGEHVAKPSSGQAGKFSENFPRVCWPLR